MGMVDGERFKKALAQLAENYDFKTTIDINSIYSDAYLPKDGSLMLQ